PHAALRLRRTLAAAGYFWKGQRMTQMSWSSGAMPGRLQHGAANWMENGFRQCWMLGVALLVLNIGRLSGAFNSNPMEKGVFLIALLLFCLKNPVNKPALSFLGLASL